MGNDAHLFAADSLISLRLTLSGSSNRLRRNPVLRLCRPHSRRSGRTGWGGRQRCRRCPHSASSVRIWLRCWGGLRRRVRRLFAASACKDEPTVLSARSGSMAAFTTARASRMCAHFSVSAASPAAGMGGKSCRVW